MERDTVTNVRRVYEVDICKQRPWISSLVLSILRGKWKQMSACISFALRVVYECALFRAEPTTVDARQQSVVNKEQDKKVNTKIR